MSGAGETAHGGRAHAFEALASVGMAIGARGIYLLTQVVIARSLGPSGFGAYALGWTVAGLGITFAGLGVQQSCIRFRVAGRHLWTLGFMPAALAFSGLVALCVAVFAEPLATVVFDAPEAALPIALLAPSIPMSVVLAVWTAAFKVAGRPLLGIGFASIGLTLGPSLAVLGVWAFGPHDPAVYALASTLGLVPALILAAVLSRLDAPEPEPTTRGQRTLFSLQSLGVHAFTVVNMWVDRLAVATLSTVTQLGLYQAASQLSMVPMMLATTITAVHEADIARAQDRDRRTVVFIRTQLLQIHVVAAGCVAGALTASSWLGLLFGHEFAGAGAALAALLLAQLIRAIGGPTVNVLNMSGAPRAALWLTGCGLVLSLGLSFLLIGPLGALGAALASLVTAVVLSVAGVRLCTARGLVDFGLRPLAGPAASIGCLLVLVVPAKALAPAGVVTDVGATLLAFVGYFAPMLVLRCYSEHDEIATAARRLLRLRRGAVPGE